MFVVAGVTGHVGSVVAKELLAKNQKVKVVVRDRAKAGPWSTQGAEVAVGSLDAPSFLSDALRGAAGFFVLLPPPPFTTTDFYGVQRKMADDIASAVHTSGVPYVVMLSSVGADLPSGNGPIRSLYHLENALRATGTKVTAIRAGSFQENIERFLGPAREAGIYPSFGPAGVPLPMIATKDIGALAAQCLTEHAPKAEIIDLHGPPYSANEVAAKLGAALGKKLQVVEIPQPGWVGAMTQAGFSQHIAEVFADMYAGFASGQTRPKGDRIVQGQTKLDETIRTVVR
jgi:uncharacterized protein YbjT (DUF2867 family)